MVALPGGRGFVEVMTEGPADARASRKSHETRIIAYFYQQDGTTELSPSPTDVTVKVGTSATSPVVPLAASKPGQKFESKPGPYPAGFEGKLDAKVNGEPVEASFLFR